jgi:para-nitrobenzyl esterase
MRRQRQARRAARAVAALGLLCAPWQGHATGPPDFPLDKAHVLRHISGGTIDGIALKNNTAFLNVPYAAPPLGPRRFRPPAPVIRWIGVRNARRRGPACPQILDTYDSSEDGEAIQSEDCLTLNVWTPTKATEPLPVMVFIHGGSFFEGSAADSFYDGSQLAQRGNVVVVTLQYRLGALGFLYLGDQGGSRYRQSGNTGLLDQIAALKWVRDNIANFSGDAHNVTLFGESSGGASIRALMVANAARGLFQKVIIESGDTGPVLSRQTAASFARRFMALAGVNSVAKLQQLSIAALLKTQKRFFDDVQLHATFGLTDDGMLFNGTVSSNVEADPSTAAPMLIGTNTEELRYFIAMYGSPIDQQPAEVLQRHLAAYLGFNRAGIGEQAEAIVKQYVASAPSYPIAVETVLSDAIFRVPSIRLAEANSQRKPTYFYSFAYRSPVRGPTGLEYGAMHGIELPFVFHVETPSAYAYVGPKGTWEGLADQLVSAWTSFARTGDPNNALMPHWPPYDVSTRATMELNLRSRVVLDPLGLERQAWDRIPSEFFESTDSIQLVDLPVH